MVPTWRRERKGEEREMADWPGKRSWADDEVWTVQEKEKRGERKIWAVGGLQEKKKKEGEGVGWAEKR